MNPGNTTSSHWVFFPAFIYFICKPLCSGFLVLTILHVGKEHVLRNICGSFGKFIFLDHALTWGKTSMGTRKLEFLCTLQHFRCKDHPSTPVCQGVQWQAFLPGVFPRIPTSRPPSYRSPSPASVEAQVVKSSVLCHSFSLVSFHHQSRGILRNNLLIS